MESQPTKTCTKCHEEKALSEFHKEKSKKDGHKFQCKKCVREYCRKYNKINKGYIKKHLSYVESHQIINGIKQKFCSKCKNWKNESEFYKNINRKDCYEWECKQCSSIKDKNYCQNSSYQHQKNWAINNPEKTRLITRKSYYKTKGFLNFLQFLQIQTILKNREGQKNGKAIG